MTAPTERRAEYVAGLRALADMLETNPHLRLPLAETFTVFCADKDALHAWLRVIPGTKAKRPNDSTGHMIVGQPRGVFGPHGFHAWIKRDEVCTRVVTGTREVVEMVPAPGAPMVEVRKTVEDVEWICEPLLAEAVSA